MAIKAPNPHTPSMYKTNATRAAEFLTLKKEMAEHINAMATDAGLFTHPETVEPAWVVLFSVFRENLSAYHAASAIESAVNARTIAAVMLPDAQLTARQSVIVGEIMLGKSNKEIARTVGYASSTVHHEVTAILAYFKVKNREQLAEYALAAFDESPPPPLS